VVERAEGGGSRLRRSSKSKSSKSSGCRFPDQHGILRGKTLVASEALASLESGCSITTTMLAKDTSHRTVFPVFTAGGGFGMKEMEGAADVLMVADPTTFRVLPWAPTTGWLLCDLYFSDGRPVPFATRHLYRKVLDQARPARLRFRRRARGRIPPLQARRRAHGAGGCRPARASRRRSACCRTAINI
jgi:glutamine synthetase